MKKWKQILAFLLICCLSLCFPSCQEAEDSDIQTADSSTGTARITLYADLRSLEYIDKIVSRFNHRNKSTHVSVKFLIDGVYESTVDQLLNSGDTSMDCFVISQASRSNELASLGMLTELGDYVRTAQLDVVNYGSAIDVARQDEQFYSLPISKNAWMLFYNKDYFDRMGEPYPQQMTWEEYADLAKRMTYQEGHKTYWGGFIPPWKINLGAAAAEEYLTDDELPITKSYVEFLNRVYNEDKSHPGLEEMYRDYGEPYELMENGQVAMMINADWGVRRLLSDERNAALDFEWDIAPLPVFDRSKKGMTVGDCTYLGISAFSEHPENAFEFALYLCGESGAQIMAENAACPAYLVESLSETYLESAQIPGAKYFFESNTVSLENGYPLYESITNEFNEEMQIYLRGGQDLEQAFQNFSDRREKIFSRSKESAAREGG